MDCTAEPFTRLVSCAQVLVPVSTIFPPLLTHLGADTRRRGFILGFWSMSPLLLAAMAVEAFRLWRIGAFEAPFASVVIATGVILVVAYAYGARLLMLGLDKRAQDRLLAAQEAEAEKDRWLRAKELAQLLSAYVSAQLSAQPRLEARDVELSDTLELLCDHLDHHRARRLSVEEREQHQAELSALLETYLSESIQRGAEREERDGRWDSLGDLLKEYLSDRMRRGQDVTSP
jgi:hypothetical protein